MGKKSRRNKNNNGGPLRKGLAAVPTAAAAPATSTTICDTVYRLLEVHNYEEILKVESKYRHLDTFSDNPKKDAYVLYAFGSAIYYFLPKDKISLERAIHFYERAKERIKDSKAAAGEQALELFKSDIESNLAGVYSEDPDTLEKAISSHRLVLANCSRHDMEVESAYSIIYLSSNFNRFEKFEYAIEVLEGSMDMMETLEEEDQAECNLIAAYIGCGEFLKAKDADKKRRSTYFVAGMHSGMIEEGLCNYKAAIAHFRKVVAGLQKQDHDDGLSKARFGCSVDLATTLLRHSADNEAEAFAIFQEELDRCVDPIDREIIGTHMGTEYRKLNKWDQSIEALQLCLSSSRPDGTMLSPLIHKIHETMANTYLEQYCTDNTLDIDQRTDILRHATDHSNLVVPLTQAQLFYFNGDKQQAYHHLELYLDTRMAECELSCYTCKQRVRHGSVPFSCASCRVASYCGRRHQKMTWKNERICHKVLCPLLGYWRMEKKKQKKRKGLTHEDQCEYETVFDTFFESICPHVKLCARIPSCTVID